MLERPWMHHQEFTNGSPRSYITYRRDSQTTRIRVQPLVSLNSSVTFLTFLSKAAVVFEKVLAPFFLYLNPLRFPLMSDFWLPAASYSVIPGPEQCEWMGRSVVEGCGGLWFLSGTDPSASPQTQAQSQGTLQRFLCSGFTWWGRCCCQLYTADTEGRTAEVQHKCAL